MPKFALTTLALATALFTAGTANAMHAYETDDCVTKLANGKTLEVTLSNDTPASPHWIVGEDEALGDLWVNFGNSTDGYDFPPKESALVLITKSRQQLSRRNTNDGCFEGYEGTYAQTAIVKAIDPKLKTAGFDLKVGQAVHFVCSESFQAPIGKHCDL